MAKNISFKIENNYIVKVEVIAALFGVTVRRVQQLTQDGTIETIKTDAGNRYELIPTLQKYIKFLSDKAYGRAKSETEAELKEQKLRAEIALKESQGELHELRTKIASGKYISIEDVEADYRQFFIAFKTFAMNIPNRLAGRLNGKIEPSEVRKLNSEMQTDVNRMLTDFVKSAVTEEADKDG